MEWLYFLLPGLQQWHKGITGLCLLQVVLAAGAAEPLQQTARAVLPVLPWPAAHCK